MPHSVDDFRLGDRAMRYSVFAPKLYNYCLSLGFRRELMMPSRAFCSDESQGYPVILLMQRFGAFPFDHGRVGGKVATDRHGPHAHHGEDLVIIQASHVGYDPVSRRFGVYQRPRIEGRGFGENCGKLCGILHWYRGEYDRAARSILCGTLGQEPAIYIDNHLLAQDREEGLFLNLEFLIDSNDPLPRKNLSTSKAFFPSQHIQKAVSREKWTMLRTTIGSHLSAEMFYFRRKPVEGPEGQDLLEAALSSAMPTLVTAKHPALDAARYHTQVEFDRTYRSVQTAPEYQGKNLLFIAGINIDVSPPEGLPFPLTKFVPWAAYWRLRDGQFKLLEQDELVDALREQSAENADLISFDAAIDGMSGAPSVSLPL